MNAHHITTQAKTYTITPSLGQAGLLAQQAKHSCVVTLTTTTRGCCAALNSLP